MRQTHPGLYQFREKLLMRGRTDWIVWAPVVLDGKPGWREERRFPLTVTVAGIARELGLTS
jgi:hypothetical protein